MTPLRPISFILSLAALAACSQSAGTIADPDAPVATTQAALQGTWRSVDDAKSMMTIRDTTVTESYVGEEPGVAALAVVADCDSQRPDPAGQSFTFEDDSAGIRCFRLLESSGDRIAYSYHARGNTLAYDRVPD
ncbi:hypothetical protein [Hyphomonas sp.]|uniref:hypothetical protein n=1 Tax=Hyphomonas sp. TaxID=87 RepID=UPI003F6F4EE0